MLARPFGAVTLLLLFSPACFLFVLPYHHTLSAHTNIMMQALVDPVLMPLVRPVLNFIEEHSPKFLRIPYIDKIRPSKIKKKLTRKSRTNADVTAAGVVG